MFDVLFLILLPGMVAAGALSDVASRSAILAAIFSVRGCTFILLRWSGGSLPLLFVFATSFGIVDYAVVPPTAGLVATHAGSDSVGLGFGLLLAIHAAGSALGAIGAGGLYDASGGRYGSTIAVSAALCFVAAMSSGAVNEKPLWGRQGPTR